MALPSHYLCTNAKLSATVSKPERSPFLEDRRSPLAVGAEAFLVVQLRNCRGSETPISETNQPIGIPFFYQWLKSFFRNYSLSQTDEYHDEIANMDLYEKDILADYLKTKSNECLLANGDGLRISIPNDNFDVFYADLCSQLLAKAEQIEVMYKRGIFVLRIEVKVSADIVYDEVRMISEALRCARTDEDFGRLRRENAIPVSAVDSLVFSSLYRVEEDDDGERFSCPICSKEYRVGDRVAMTPCFHSFHLVCVSKWLLKHNRTCPMCRFSFGG